MEGEPFTIVCNLFSKIYFVTIYLSFKKGKLLPTPTPKKKTFFFPQQLLVWLCMTGYLRSPGDTPVGLQSLGVGHGHKQKASLGWLIPSQTVVGLASGLGTTTREGMGWSGELGVGGSCLAFLASCE